MSSIKSALTILGPLGLRAIGSKRGAWITSPDFPQSLEHSEYIRFFSPQIIHIYGSKALTGTLGIISKGIINNLNGAASINEFMIASCFSANFTDLMTPPVFGASEHDDVEWCSKMLDILLGLPTSQEDLIEYISSNKYVGGFPIKRMTIPESQRKRMGLIF